MAHRGDSARQPENTLEAFAGAAAAGASWIELDVRLSKDKIPMVFHDHRLNRMCQAAGTVSGHTCAELQQLKVKEQFAIPTLEQVLTLAQEKRMGTYVELKDQGQDVVSAVAPLVANSTSPVIVSSFHRPTLWKVRKRLPHQPLMALSESRWFKPWRSWPLGHVKEIGISLALARAGVLNELVEAGWDVLVFTVNDAITAKRLREHGAAGVFCDHAGGL